MCNWGEQKALDHGEDSVLKTCPVAAAAWGQLQVLSRRTQMLHHGLCSGHFVCAHALISQGWSVLNFRVGAYLPLICRYLHGVQPLRDFRWDARCGPMLYNLRCTWYASYEVEEEYLVKSLGREIRSFQVVKHVRSEVKLSQQCKCFSPADVARTPLLKPCIRAYLVLE